MAALALLCVSTHALSEPLVDAFVARLGESMRAIRVQAKGNADLTRAGCRDLLSQLLALDVMARRSAGEAWDKMTNVQRDAFRAAFAERMASECVRSYSDYNGDAIEPVGVRAMQDGDKMATVRFGAEADNGKRITWRLRQIDAETWRVVDVIVEGSSAVLTARNEYAAILQSHNGNIEALLASMRK
ncbi:MAG: ABC transporter substrate-binding protein [Rhizobiales bacterium]|nr:ABC transporter substrate-binding protein [Hyphomicrobiales bacterium]